MTPTLLEPVHPPLHPHVLPPPAQLSPPQPPPPDLEDKVNFPTKVREVEENNVAPIVNTLLATAPHTPNGHFEITLEFLKIDFPWKTDYVEVQDVLNFAPRQKQQYPDISIEIDIQYHQLWAPDQKRIPKLSISMQLQPPQSPDLELSDVPNRGEINPRISPWSDCFGLPTLFAITVLCAPDVIKTLLSANNISLFMPPPAPLILKDRPSETFFLEPPQEPTVVIVDHVNPGEGKKKKINGLLEETALLFIPLLTIAETKEFEKDFKEVETGQLTRRFSRRLSSASEIRSLHCKPPPSTAVTRLLLTLRLSPPPPPSNECSDRVNIASSRKSFSGLLNLPPYIEVDLPEAACQKSPVLQKHLFETDPPQPPCLDLPDRANKRCRPWHGHPCRQVHCKTWNVSRR